MDEETFHFEVTTDDFQMQAEIFRETQPEPEKELVFGRILPGVATVTLGSEKDD